MAKNRYLVAFEGKSLADLRAREAALAEKLRAIVAAREAAEVREAEAEALRKIHAHAERLIGGLLLGTESLLIKIAAPQEIMQAFRDAQASCGKEDAAAWRHVMTLLGVDPIPGEGVQAQENTASDKTLEESTPVASHATTGPAKRDQDPAGQSDDVAVNLPVTDRSDRRPAKENATSAGPATMLKQDRDPVTDAAAPSPEITAAAFLALPYQERKALVAVPDPVLALLTEEEIAGPGLHDSERPKIRAARALLASQPA